MSNGVDTVRACPECDRADQNTPRQGYWTAGDKRYRCAACGATHDGPVSREWRSNNGHSGAGAALIEMDPDDLGDEFGLANAVEDGDSLGAESPTTRTKSTGGGSEWLA